VNRRWPAIVDTGLVGVNSFILADKLEVVKSAATYLSGWKKNNSGFDFFPV